MKCDVRWLLKLSEKRWSEFIVTCTGQFQMMNVGSCQADTWMAPTKLSMPAFRLCTGNWGSLPLTGEILYRCEWNLLRGSWFTPHQCRSGDISPPNWKFLQNFTIAIVTKFPFGSSLKRFRSYGAEIWGWVLLQIFSALLRQNYTSDVKVFSRLDSSMDLLNRPNHDGALTSLVAGGGREVGCFFCSEW